MTSPGKWGHCHHCFYSPWTTPLPCPKQSIIGCHGSQQEDIARSWELGARSPLRPSCLPSALPCVCLCALGFSACSSTPWAHMGPHHPEKLTVRATVFGADKLRLTNGSQPQGRAASQLLSRVPPQLRHPRGLQGGGILTRGLELPWPQYSPVAPTCICMARKSPQERSELHPNPHVSPHCAHIPVFLCSSCLQKAE